MGVAWPQPNQRKEKCILNLIVDPTGVKSQSIQQQQQQNDYVIS